MPTEPASRTLVESHYVRALEGRVAELEKQCPEHKVDHLPSNQAAALNRQTLPDQPRMATASANANSRTANDNSHGSGRIEQQPSTIVEDISMSPANQPHSRSIPRGSYSNPSPSATAAISIDDDSDTGLDQLIYGLVASPSTCDDGRHSALIVTPVNAPAATNSDFLPQTLITAMPAELQQVLITAYKDRAQTQYPMFHWNHFVGWLSDWKACASSDLPSRYWQGFFANLVCSTALLLLSLPRVVQSDAKILCKQGMTLLPYVLRQPSPILHVQVYLLLSIHALHRSSTPRVISLASTTMRYCIQFQFHLADVEPDPVDVTIRLWNQLRRRCFWCAYIMDQVVMSSFELLPSISDTMITAKLYANIDDDDIEMIAARAAADQELPDLNKYTSVSSSLHILQCRRIQSGIFGYTLHWDYKSRYENSLDWRLQVLNELESYKARVQNFTDPQSKGYTSQRWLAMIYHYTLLTLYRPTMYNVLGPAGDWSIQAGSQACLIFRKFQMDRQIAQAWLGLLVQFQSSVTILYCC
ncbi:hypothetical protein H9Q69_013281 [Fusarium xylarioides]|uniref:Xylanolytic transcriptional activator regulatory domain-containing protein n=1 Tax=Fusarium xylarioides TaxID=221167 RepID=A0A9P7HIX6_9HYPO|nr:hypothetical protein H9Q70_012719 [Fusarium xylarioides]KAG5758392.1 hypothetical protein H9Q72_013468 [Fusarium xylarioides]KAG5770673.1 hypothetical protein H9Q73_013115 [Fusarium xylarioides]KAG5787656.1 hypothetical protein H9Q69_013281 [Fusarium xylarioides]